MGFMEEIEQRSLPIRQAILSHPFVTGVGSGDLPVEKFKYYVAQDYVYLIDYSRTLALAAARAPDLDVMSWFAGLLDSTLNTEMALHLSYCAEFGISVEELENTQAAPTTVAYTSFLLKTASQGSFGELVASLVPCGWGLLGDWRSLGQPRSPAWRAPVRPVDRHVRFGRVPRPGVISAGTSRTARRRRRSGRTGGDGGGLRHQPALGIPVLGHGLLARKVAGLKVMFPY